MKRFLLLAIILVSGCDKNYFLGGPSPTPTPVPQVTVNPTPPSNPSNPVGVPIILLFAADNYNLSFFKGETTTIRWEVADQKAIVRIDPFPGNVPSIGSALVVPSRVGTISFTLTATNANGSSQRFFSIVVQ